MSHACAESITTDHQNGGLLCFMQAPAQTPSPHLWFLLVVCKQGTDALPPPTGLECGSDLQTLLYSASFKGEQQQRGTYILTGQFIRHTCSAALKHKYLIISQSHCTSVIHLGMLIWAKRPAAVQVDASDWGKGFKWLWMWLFVNVCRC